MRAKWIEYTKKADFTAWARELGISPLTARLIRNRDVLSLEEAGRYLHMTMDDVRDPLLMKDMEKAVLLLEEAVRTGVRTAIVSDFDDDGIFAGEILYEGIRRLGGEAVIYTPDRILEGYGINRRIVELAKAEGCGLILTCDNGIAALEEVSYAKELGLTVIVTDHHEVRFEEAENGEKRWLLPQADAVVDPKRADSDFPFDGICGAGVAFLLIRTLYRRKGIPEAEERRFYEYLAIATVADVVPLKDENRAFVRAGLETLPDTRHPGLKALLEASGIAGRELTAYHLGFVLGPSFNAAGRLSRVRLAFDLLQAEDPDEAARIAQELRALNDRRKAMTEEGHAAAAAEIEKAPWKEDRVYVLHLPEVHESVAGIVAGRLKEQYARPVIVFTGTGEILKGSGRSVEAYHMMRKIQEAGHLLTRFGGHAMAAGMSMEAANLPAFRTFLNEHAGLREEDLRKTLYLDARAPLSMMTEGLIREIGLLEPYGTGNPEPLFARPHFRILKITSVGRTRKYLKLTVDDGSGPVMDAMYFGDAEEFLSYVREYYGDAEVRAGIAGLENRIDLALAFYPTLNEFRGRRTVEIVIRDYCVIG